MEEYLTVADAAKRIGLSPAGVKAATAAGRLPMAAKTVNGQRLYLAADVDEFSRQRGRRSRGK